MYCVEHIENGSTNAFLSVRFLYKLDNSKLFNLNGVLTSNLHARQGKEWSGVE